MDSSTIIKGCGVVYKEMDKAIDNNVVQSWGEVMEITLHDNVFASLYYSLAT